MAAKQGTSVHGSGQDDSEESTTSSGNSPPHGHLSHGGGRFLWEVDPDTLPDEGWIEELQTRYQNWAETGDAEQSSMEEWSG